LNAEARLACEEQQLHVEGKPIERQPRKQHARRFGLNQLEAALGIVDTGHCHELNDAVEDASDDMAERRLVDPLRTGRLTRPHDQLRRIRLRRRVQEYLPVARGD
jgi:hypothetical protein